VAVQSNPQSEIALTFDVEEHHRIEAAAAFVCPPDLKRVYAERMDVTTRWLLDMLGERGIRATFFVVGEIAKARPALVRRMADEGHEVASHSWDHRRVHRFTPASFREDVRTSVDALQQAAGVPVVGFRAPTFSVMRETAWAIDELAELGIRYDSSIFPVRHDRYGVPDAPRSPFIVQGRTHELLELPPLTLRALGHNLPVAGGGYFRLFPLFVMERGIRKSPASGVLYFHPWEFDPGQPRLPLNRLSRFRTYVGIGRSRDRFARLLSRHKFGRLIDRVEALSAARETLPHFPLAAAWDARPTGEVRAESRPRHSPIPG
jgi:polysaccharide deacetylase family protein (PEP-CTERM system associated)